MNFNCYNKDQNGIYVSVNPEFMAFAQAKVLDDLLGRTDQELPWSKSAAHIMGNDAKVMATGKSLVFIEQPVIRGKHYARRCFKSPLLDRSGKIIGIMGMSLPLEPSTLVPLSVQQNAVLKELALGGSIKQIAKNLGLSPRTVEHYLNSVKIKCDCESRSDLILQAIARGLVV